MVEPLPPVPVQLERLAALHRAGELSDEVFAQCRAAIERQLEPSAAVPAETRPSRRLQFAVAGFAVALAGAGYAWLGTPQAWGVDTPAGVSVHAIDGSAHALGDDQIDAMIDRLAARLESGGGDADGWAMLARSRAVRGRHAEAVSAFRKAIEGRPQDARLLVDFADALAMTQGGRIDGEPMKLIEAALKIDPDNVKGLALAGTAAFHRKDYREAVKRWERVTAVAAPDDPIAENLDGGLAEARRLAGLPAPAADKAPAAASVSGMVTLPRALAAQASPDDTVFVFARSADGTRMPLAILRKKVSDLPIRFVLDDSLSMSPQARLSSARQVIVSARISKTGEAMPRDGDLEGRSTVVAVGTQGVNIEVRERVKAGS